LINAEKPGKFIECFLADDGSFQRLHLSPSPRWGGVMMKQRM